MSTPLNPYAPPIAKVDDITPAAPADAEAIRKEHIKHEASIRSVGALYYIGAVLMIVGAGAMFAKPDAEDASIVANALAAVFVVGFGVASIAIGRGLRTLRKWVLIPAVVFSVVGLLGFPVGTLINGYIIWLLLSKKGRMVLSPEYAAIVAATPQIKYRISILIWIFLGLIVLALFAAVAIPMLSR